MNLSRFGGREFDQWALDVIRYIHETAASGLDEKEAIRRARRLEEGVLAGRVTPADVSLEAEGKDVLYALVYRVIGSHQLGPEETARRASAIREFIRGVAWKGDPREKEKLLEDCSAQSDFWEMTSSAATSSRPGAEEINESPEEETRRVFDRFMPLVKALVAERYQLKGRKARRLERDLLAWFLRFRKRPDPGDHDTRSILFGAATEFVGREAIAGTTPSLPEAEATLERLLRRAFFEAARLRASRES